jgi:hypothetical protein
MFFAARRARLMRIRPSPHARLMRRLPNPPLGFGQHAQSRFGHLDHARILRALVSRRKGHYRTEDNEGNEGSNEGACRLPVAATAIL